jgi:hypothetical protein
MGLRGFWGVAVVYCGGWFCENGMAEVHGSGHVAAYSLELAKVCCGRGHDISVCGAHGYL